jgi:hypothetical protein
MTSDTLVVDGEQLAQVSEQHATREAGGRRPLVWILRGAATLAVLAVAYYGVLGSLAHRIDNDVTFAPADGPGGSAAVSMASALVQREVVDHGWMPNDPWFAPNAFLDNTPNFQQGILRAVARFSFEMLDQIARTRGSSSADPDLERATGLLQFPGDVWILDFDKSWLPTIPSEDQYRAGLRALQAYNTRLANGQAVFERRADVLAATLSRISADLGSQSASLENKVGQAGGWIFSTRADDIFYQNKGMLYGYYMMLSSLGEDFAQRIEERGVTALWDQALASLRTASQLQPLIVVNAAGADSIFANHLVLQGFYMKRSILQLEEVASALAV